MFVKNIYLLWLQGWNNAPLLQKKVLQSWINYNPDYNIIKIDYNNLKKFDLNIDYIYDKNKKITPQALSDIIRVSLLKKYGGIWADATFLCLKPINSLINNYLLDNNIFMYYRPNGGAELSHCLYSFIVADSNSKIINNLKESVDIYWNKNNVAHKYFWLEELLTCLFEKNKECKDEFDNMKKINADEYYSSHGLAGKINNIPKMLLIDENYKKNIVINKPYVVKLWKHLNPYLNHPHIDKTNAGFLLKLVETTKSKLSK
jgi:hypothetical protein